MEFFKCQSEEGLNEAQMKKIISELQAGRLIVYPTETIYGLGADPFDETAVRRVYMAKRRPFDMPMSIAVSSLKMMEELAILDNRARNLVEKFMPGPLTLILTKKPVIPDILTSSTSEIGIRIPDHPVALKIIEAFGPIITTSANLHSHPNPTTAEEAKKDLGGTVSVYIDCGPSKIGKPSTIVQLSEGEPSIIRSGAIPPEEIEAALNE